MYDLEITIRRRGSAPFRVSRIQDEARVAEVVDSFVAAWGLPHPDLLQPREEFPLIGQLRKSGQYRSEQDDYLIIVKRSV